ncbi:hypothetical protein BN8_03543 [Fibrisoma limi BUZ 3]|uniref:Uncharacterized protein n=1 Tax=Fibrisoma limi BUZ 3 TaxID=1185876 RepID=I2GKF4_9BACT|nr:hypothetical protein [Fibrisoma limi]CCH54379.1 hypothetical protein BN8_03543 [Fibrisoma limi BUZ 3]
MNQDDELLYIIKGGSKTRLPPYGKDLFYMASPLTTLQYERDTQGTVSGYQLMGIGVPWMRLLSLTPINRAVSHW